MKIYFIIHFDNNMEKIIAITKSVPEDTYGNYIKNIKIYMVYTPYTLNYSPRFNNFATDHSCIPLAQCTGICTR